MSLLGLTYIVARRVSITKSLAKGWGIGFVMLLLTYLVPNEIIAEVQDKFAKYFFGLEAGERNTIPQYLTVVSVGLGIAGMFILVEKAILANHKTLIDPFVKKFYKWTTSSTSYLIYRTCDAVSFYNTKYGIIKLTELGCCPACQTLCVWILFKGSKYVRIDALTVHALIVILWGVDLAICLNRGHRPCSQAGSDAAAAWSRHKWSVIDTLHFFSVDHNVVI